MKKSKVSSDLAYNIKLSWFNDYILCDCIERRVAALFKDCRSYKELGLDYSLFIEDIMVLRNILRQIYLHKTL